MCRFISFFHRPDNGDIAVYDLCSHSDTEQELELNLNLWREGHYLPDETIECRVEPKDNISEKECNERLKRKYKTFAGFFNFATKNMGKKGSLCLSGCDLSKITKLPQTIVGNLDLSGCDLSKITKLPQTIGGYLDLRGCDLSKIKEWPQSIGGHLDLRGCDLSKITKWPQSIGGGLYLRGCDLSKIKEWPQSIGRYLVLSGCDLSKTKIPERFKDKIIK